MNSERIIAQALIEIGAVGFVVQSPITFVSGILSPVYIDNRKFPFHPAAWKKVIEGFAELVESKNLKLEVIAGVEAAGIPHSAALGYHTNTPSVFIRKKPKDHGTKKMVEGGNVEGKNVILIEDLVTTGMSSLNAVSALKNEGAKVTDVAVIITYGFPEAEEAFLRQGIALHTLTTFPIVLEEAKALGKITDEEAASVLAWTRDPHNWKPA